MALSDVQYILLLNTVLAGSCTTFTVFGLWPFRGLFHSWIFANAEYTFVMHTHMIWFGVGCLGLFATNLQALATFDDETGTEAYTMVFVTNVVMHGVWGIHNLHLIYRKMRKQDDDTINELRRPFPLLMYSAAGVCGSAAVRNIYALSVPMDDLSTAVIIFTWIWEWLGLIVTLIDFVYYLLKEHKCGSNVVPVANLKTAHLAEQVSAHSPPVSPTTPPSTGTH